MANLLSREKKLTHNFDDGQNVVYSIQDKQPLTMIVKRAEKDHSTILYLKASNVFWPDANANPYSKVNSQWRFRPGKPESNEELRERLKGCVKFYELFFKGHSESESNEIDFLGLPTCFKWYQGGIFVQSAKTLDKKWINCFYSEDQAQQARQMMQDVLSKKYDWDTTQRNWVKQLVPILKQVQNRF
jgi:hypothetical protein